MGVTVAASKAVMLHLPAMDEYSHSEAWYLALREAFAACGTELALCNVAEPGAAQLMRHLADPAVGFFVTFNGVGMNLAWQRAGEGITEPLFDHFRKPVLDHFTDPPYANEMQHANQLASSMRVGLYTDHSYLVWSGLFRASAPSAYFVPEFIPLTRAELDARPARFSDRSIEVLYPVSLYDPDAYYRQALALGEAYGPVCSAVFGEIVDTYLHAERSEGLEWALRVFPRHGLAFDPSSGWHRPLLACAWHYIKNVRRRAILEALRDVPVTLLTRSLPYAVELHPRSQVISARTFREMCELLEQARICLCPTPHYRGYNERILTAMALGTLAVSPPNQVCEEHFRNGEEIVFYRGAADDLASKVGELVAQPSRAEEMAGRGSIAAREGFGAGRAVASMLTVLANFNRRGDP
ncbi:MAG: hypothetical protein EXR27_03970 [Betaproteobacteria bacterium]|nr:hypothetical protein [Betaproteobacteria bacterium]